MKDCPTCLIPVDGMICPKCGHTDPGATPAKPAFDRRCADVLRGQRCANPGSFSHSTHGGGPWLCWEHFAPGAFALKPTAPPHGFQSLKSIIRKVDPESAAERNAQADGL